MLEGVRNGARLYVIDPRRTPSAQWADGWLGLDVGTDIALANAMAREIIDAGLENRPFIERATEGFDEYAASVEPYTLAEGERLTGVPAEVIRDMAHAYARADRAMICWTLGITEHHNAVDNVLALINLASSPAMSDAGARGSTRCAARTTCRAAATWARSRTSSPASRTSSATRGAGADSSRPGARRSGRSTAGT